jgi:steroid 5-alpha reductase family enzyme
MTALFETFFLIMILMFLLWLLSLWLKDVSIVDIFWSPGFAIIVWAASLLRPSPPGIHAAALQFLVTVWAIRLGSHLFVRWLGHKGEDRRYAAMRRKFGPNWWWWSFFQVFLLQGVLMCVISIPLQMSAAHGPAPLTPLFYVGIAVAVGGLLVEAIADLQLTRFRRDPTNADKVMDRGVWSWSRHPNYFGDALMWWGFYLIVLSASLSLWWTAFGPAIMTFLLLRVSGVTLLEHTIARRRPEYEDYIRRTSVFIPLPPRR